MEVRMFTVGQIQENTYIFRRDGSDRALIVDPGDEADKLLAAIDALGVKLDGILLTHTHFDHVGAVAPVARATGAEVWVPKIEAGRARRHHELRAVAGLRPVRVLRRGAHARGRRAARAGRLRDRRAVHPRAQPRPRDLLDPGRAGDLLRRRAVPGSRSAAPTCRAATTARCSSRSGRWWTRSPRRPPSTRATWAPRHWARSGRQTRSWPSWRGEEAPGAARHARRAAPGWAPPARARDADRRGARARGLRADRDARVRGHRGVRARGGGVHGHRPEGDVHVRGQGRPLAHAAPGGHRRHLPRVHRARHAQAAAAGEGLGGGPVLPPRGARRPGASASSRRSTRRRSAPTTPASTPS